MTIIIKVFYVCLEKVVFARYVKSVWIPKYGIFKILDSNKVNIGCYILPDFENLLLAIHVSFHIIFDRKMMIFA